ncbi:hypothetical protein H6P81_020774 [Aristolochia fimbriata]|uniref:ATP-dependent DNA helicase n=1 Tax=Aristolochia fimbriata TaxID=158543 RepID=A0AAV7DWE9_ARIFI|nr:hypothetical protein H6P81_020774 [Aristolochia fimbriata]
MRCISFLGHFHNQFRVTQYSFNMLSGQNFNQAQVHTNPECMAAHLEDHKKPRTPLTPKQRERMERNRCLALAKQERFHKQRSLGDQCLPPQEKASFLNIDHHTFNSDCVQCGKKSPCPSSSSSRGVISLSKEQLNVLQAVVQGRSVFITGSAGTGKTFLLKHVIRVLQEMHSPDHVYVTASTGVAACALNGQTLHSFAGVGLGSAAKEFLYLKASKNKLTRRRWKHVKALVIDEVSMIDGELFDSLDYIAQKMRSYMMPKGKAWGGIQLVVSGDFFQLPPVKAPNLLKEFAFEADCWYASFDLQVELTRIFRQSDSQLIELLQGVRRGEKDPKHLQLLSSCSTVSNLSEEEAESITRLYPRNEDVRRVNNQRLRSLGGEISTYRAVDSGTEPWKSQLIQGIAPDELELCLGAKVMLIKNLDPDQGLVNGTVGMVTGFVDGSGTLDLCSTGLSPKVYFESGVEKVLEPESWDVMEGETVRATRRQVPLILAWALSIHKCQGMTLSRLHTDLSRAFGYAMVYVALSRLRSLDGLHLSGFDPQKIKAHPKVLQFYDSLLSTQI